MDLLVVGLNHVTAPVALRERVAFTPEQLANVLPALKTAGEFRELAVLSTCNRTEIITVGGAQDPSVLISWLADYHDVGMEALIGSTYSYHGPGAVQHVMRVACGLESMVLGEPQILGQFKDCFAIAQRHNTLGPDLNNLAQATNRIAKKVRTETGIGENPVSVASMSVTLAKQLFTDVATCNVLLVGAGETIELVAQHLAQAGVTSMVIANRTLVNAQTLASEFQAQAVDLAALPLKLAETDILISSTGSSFPILDKGTVETALKARRHKPIFMVDLAIPRDIEPDVATLRDVYLYTVDDLQGIIQDNLDLRQSAAKAATEIIAQAVIHYAENHRSLDAVDTLRRFRSRHEQLKQLELEKALARLAKGDDAEVVLSALATQLTNKIVHIPSIEIKKAGSTGRRDLLDAIENLFQLNEDETKK